ncbi:MAG: hypothetical protein OEU40_09300 [Gammaproteobacteria bacterium]|nr:hypothetical protein [Gammaproteobacteria bacterium]
MGRKSGLVEGERYGYVFQGREQDLSEWEALEAGCKHITQLVILRLTDAKSQATCAALVREELDGERRKYLE